MQMENPPDGESDQATSIRKLLKKKQSKEAVRNRIGNTFRKIDFFGHSIGFSFRGSFKYTTNIGATCSLLVIIVTIVFAGYRLDRLFEDTLYEHKT